MSKVRSIVAAAALALLSTPALAKSTEPADAHRGGGTAKNGHRNGKTEAKNSKAKQKVKPRARRRPAAPFRGLVTRFSQLESAVQSNRQNQQEILSKLSVMHERLFASLGIAVPETPSKEHRQRVAALNAELRETGKKLAKLNEAVSGGLDRSLVSDSIKKLESQRSQLKRSIDAAENRDVGEKASLPARLDRVHEDVKQLNQTLTAFLDVGKRAVRSARAAPAAGDAPVVVAKKEEKRIGLDVEVTLASAYADRGNNAFQSERQNDQHFMLSPSVTFNIGETGLWLNYSSMYQLNGDNAGQLVAEGVGHEQDIAVGFNRGFLGERLGLSTYLNVVLYPFASKEDAGTRVPVVLEPAVGLAYSTFVDLGLELTWSVGVQDAISDGRFLYINPTLGKELGLTSSLSMALGAGLGVKVFHDPEANPDNQFDLAFDCEFPVKLAGNVSVKPGVHIGWTDLDGKSAGDEYFVFGSLVMALSL